MSGLDLSAVTDGLQAATTYVSARLTDPAWHRDWNTSLLLFLVLRHGVPPALLEETDWSETVIRYASTLFAAVMGAMAASMAADPGSLVVILLYLLFAVASWNRQTAAISAAPPPLGRALIRLARLPLRRLLRAISSPTSRKEP